MAANDTQPTTITNNVDIGLDPTDPCYDVINDKHSFINDVLGKYKVIPRLATMMTGITWVVITTSYLWSSKPVNIDIYTQVCQLWTYALLIHLIGINGLERVLDTIKIVKSNNIQYTYGGQSNTPNTQQT